MQRIHVTHFSEVWPFVDSVNVLLAALGELNLDVSYEPKRAVADRLNIVLAAHYTNCNDLFGVARDIIVYNQEHISAGISFVNRLSFFRLLKRCWIWDYSWSNVDRLRSAGIGHARYLPIGDADGVRILSASEEKDIDILFYGVLSERRCRIIDRLCAQGLKVTWYQTDRPYDLPLREQAAARNRLIERSKIVLNLHNSDEPDRQNLEIARIGFLLSNRVPVVTEICSSTTMDAKMRDILRGGTEAELATLLRGLLEDDHARTRYAEDASRHFAQSFPQSELLQQGLEDYWRAAQPGSGGRPLFGATGTSMLPAPTKVQFGNGSKWSFDYLNVDVDSRRRPDMILDLNQPLPFGRVVDTWRFGPIRLEKGSIDYILAENAMAHLVNFHQAMLNCLDLLREGGVLEIEVPYELSLGAWRDPTHVRAFNEHSWLYYTGSMYYHYGLDEYCFDQEMLLWIVNQTYHDLHAKDISEDELFRTPRTVDAMRVRLRKRALTPQEKEAVRAHFPNPGDDEPFPCEQA